MSGTGKHCFVNSMTEVVVHMSTKKWNKPGREEEKKTIRDKQAYFFILLCYAHVSFILK